MQDAVIRFTRRLDGGFRGRCRADKCCADATARVDLESNRYGGGGARRGGRAEGALPIRPQAAAGT